MTTTHTTAAAEGISDELREGIERVEADRLAEIQRLGGYGAGAVTQEQKMSKKTASKTFHNRVDYICFLGGKLVSQGRFSLSYSTTQATAEAKKILQAGGFSRVSCEVNGVIVSTVAR